MARPVQLLSQYSLAGKAPDYVEINGTWVGILIWSIIIFLQSSTKHLCGIFFNYSLFIKTSGFKQRKDVNISH